MSAARILVVDDEPDVETMISQRFRRQIRKGEMEFRFARDGQEALDAIAEGRTFDVILSDINMPRMDGLTLLERLNDLEVDLKTVMVSAYGDMGNIRTAMNRGAFDFVTKPIEFIDLETTLNKTLEHLAMLRRLHEEKEAAEKAHAMLSRYFSPRLVDTLSRDPNCMSPLSERRVATFLFTDLEKFTPFIETAPTETIVSVLNDYLTGVTDTVFSHGGTVMKIVGDAVHAVFGAPVHDDDHFAQAVRCALAIDIFSESFRAGLAERGLEIGITRIGVNTGEAVIGNFGGEKFFEYTAYGDAVNVAARLEQANKVIGTRICLSQGTPTGAQAFALRPVGTVLLKGKSEKVEVLEPLAEGAPALAYLPDYLAAFEMLKSGNPGARQAFAALVSKSPDDALAMFHLGRLLSGKSDVEIALPGS